MNDENKNQVAVVEEKPVAATPETANILTAILEYAKNPDIDLDRLDKLMDIKERVEAGEARKLFAIDFAAMKPKLPRVIKLGKNEQTKSTYAYLDDVNSTVDPILAQYGFATSCKVIEQTDNSVTVLAELWHRSGHVESTPVKMALDNKGIQGSVNKTLPHATKSSITYAKGTAICALLNISTGDDTDGNTPSEAITIEQAAEIDKKLNDVGADKKAFLKYMGVDDVRNIPASKYQLAMVSIAKAFAKKGEKK